MSEMLIRASQVLRAALARQDDPVKVTLTLPSATARKVAQLVEAENVAGAVVVPVKEQFTTTEAAKMLGISRPTLMKMIAAGEIESAKVASHNRIPAQAIRDVQRARFASRSQATEALNELAEEANADFRSNVTFGPKSDG